MDKMMDEITEALSSALLSLQKYQMVSIPVCFLGNRGCNAMTFCILRYMTMWC